VAGTNVDKNGQTFIKLGWNPIYLEDATPFKNEMPKWGVKIECDGEGCNGLPCAIDPTENKVNEMVGSSSNGAGGGAFCVVTVPKGVNANFVVFDESGGSGRGGSGHDNSGHEDPAPGTPEPSSPPSSSAAPESTHEASPSPISSWSDSSSSDDYATSTIDLSSSDATPTAMYSPHEFFENSTSTSAVRSASVTQSMSQTSPITAARTGGASAAHISIASLTMSSLIVFMTIAFSS
jgi:hypothetical protein